MELTARTGDWTSKASMKVVCDGITKSVSVGDTSDPECGEQRSISSDGVALGRPLQLMNSLIRPLYPGKLPNEKLF